MGSPSLELWEHYAFAGRQSPKPTRECSEPWRELVQRREHARVCLYTTRNFTLGDFMSVSMNSPFLPRAWRLRALIRSKMLPPHHKLSSYVIVVVETPSSRSEPKLTRPPHATCSRRVTVHIQQHSTLNNLLQQQCHVSSVDISSKRYLCFVIHANEMPTASVLPPSVGPHRHTQVLPHRSSRQCPDQLQLPRRSRQQSPPPSSWRAPRSPLS